MKSIALSLTISLTMLLISISILYHPPSSLLNYWLSNAITEKANLTTASQGNIATHNSCHLDRPIAVMFDSHSSQLGMFYLGEPNTIKANEHLNAADCAHANQQRPSSRLLTYNNIRSTQAGKFILVFHPRLEDVLVFEMAAQQYTRQTKPVLPGAVIEM